MNWLHSMKLKICWIIRPKKRISMISFVCVWTERLPKNWIDMIDKLYSAHKYPSPASPGTLVFARRSCCFVFRPWSGHWHFTLVIDLSHSMAAEIYTAEWNIALHSFIQFPYLIDDENAYEMRRGNKRNILVCKKLCGWNRNTCNFMIVLCRLRNLETKQEWQTNGQENKSPHSTLLKLYYTALDCLLTCTCVESQNICTWISCPFVLHAGIALLLLNCSMLFDMYN